MRRLRAINVLFFAIGVVGLAILIVHTGPARIGDGLAQVGWAFPLVCLAHLAAIVSDSVMLWACADRQTRIRSTLRASLAGHGINEATPLAKLGEITKFTLLCETLPRERAAAALIVQNLTMFVAGCATIASGSVVTLVVFPIEGAMAQLLFGAAIGFAVIALVALIIFRFGIGLWPFRLLGRLGVGEERLARWRSRWDVVASHWQSVTRNRGAMAINFSAAIVSRVAEVGQAAIILAALGSQSVLAAAIMSVASFQLILWATSFIPMQMGSHEAGAYALFGAVGLSPGAGLLLELIRKLRRVTFVFVGVTVLGVASLRGILAVATVASESIEEEE